MASSDGTRARPQGRASALAQAGAGVDAGGVVVPIADGESIVRRGAREIGVLVALDDVTIIHARCAAGERVAGPHVHHEHTDAFYVLEGELTFEIGSGAETVAVGAGGFVAVPPQVAHAFRNASDRPARWLTIHAHDGGFAAFMRGVRDGVEVEWDISAVPAGGGLSAGHAVVSLEGGGAREPESRPCRVRCALPDVCVVEWLLRGRSPALPFRRGHHGVDSFLVIEGELEATLAGRTQSVRRGTLVSVPCGAEHVLEARGPDPARVLGIHTPDGGLAARLRRVCESVP